MKKVLVFGSSGMLGSYFCNYLEEKGYEVIRNDFSSQGVDITKEDQVNRLVSETDPQYVVNCAAYTNVNKAEEEPDMAYKVNGDAPGYMANICKELNIPFIHISTDYVFGDNRKEGYVEECDHFKPLNVYGRSKLEGEKKVLAQGGKSYIFRTSWLFGPNATNFISKISEYAKELPELKVVIDEIGCPTYVGDLSKAMSLAIEGEIDPGIYHVCSRESISRYEFAKKILEKQEIDIPVKKVKLDDFERAAAVPRISVLLNTKLPEGRTVDEMLTEYFEVLNG